MKQPIAAVLAAVVVAAAACGGFFAGRNTAAKNAGLPCITVLWGFRDKGFLTEQGATVFANTPKEVFDLLTGERIGKHDP